MVANLLRSRTASALLVFVVLVLFMSAAYRLHSPEDFLRREPVNEAPKVALPDIYRPSIQPNSPVYVPFGAFEYKLPDDRPNSAKWPNSLGKQLCILDMDSRPQDRDGDIFGKQALSWQSETGIPGPTLGLLQHWLYAKIHGYQYYFVETGDFPDRRASWKKPPIISRVLEKHSTVVFLDSDAVISHLDLPFEWLLNYWSFNRETDSLAMAVDPDSAANRDEKGRVYANTGFIIAHNRTETFTILDDWKDCANDGGKFPNCTNYRDKYHHHPSDQGGFGNYIRYEYDNALRELPCSEANGFPEHESKCRGTFVKHLWTAKRDRLKIAVGEMMPGVLLEVLHKQMLVEKDSFYITEKELMDDKWLQS